MARHESYGNGPYFGGKKMARAMMIFVCDDPVAIESARTFAQVNNYGFQLHSTQEWNQRDGHGVPSLVAGMSSPQDGAKILQFPTKPSVGLDARVKTMNEMESEAIQKAIHEFNGNLTEAAKALGIGRATLYRKVKQYSIDPSAARRKRAA